MQEGLLQRDRKISSGKAAVSPMSVFEKGIKSLGDMLNCSKKMAKKSLTLAPVSTIIYTSIKTRNHKSGKDL